MLRYLKVSAIILAALFAIAQPLQAQHFVRVAPRVIVRPYPYYGGFGYWYGPSWYYPWGPSYVVPRYYQAYQATGEVKIVTHLKDASIYVDGGYAGVTGKLKHFDLTPGNHEIELRDPSGHTIYQQKVQVLAGQKTEIRVERAG
jgi:hypothetical protein